ncbi:hypothetical protein GQ600_16058 [Phytophthora cactorum]|nr:hypothetical protein GQ600_16058 [Phytophthora cactorum]
MLKIGTEAEAEKLFAIGMNRLKLLPTIRARRGSQQKVSTFLRLVREAKKAANQTHGQYLFESTSAPSRTIRR